jgi:hypothetical protein
VTNSIDVIGDIHGERPALVALGRQLGYDVDNNWVHPEGRLPVFLGDLIDRGGHSLEVAELVRHLVVTGRGACIMGNHEYNLVAWSLKVPGEEGGKKSNEATRADIQRRPGRWKPVLEFFRKLPMAYALPDLRIIHACWHRPSFEAVSAALAPRQVPPVAAGTVGWLASHVALESPFDEHGLKAGLPQGSPEQWDTPHELLLKGHELKCASFDDVDGHPRDARRVTWWNEETDSVLHDRAQVVGHYWNLPPVAEPRQFCPPHSSGHPDLEAWQKKWAGQVKGPGRTPLVGDIACVDFNGLTQADEKRACVGALRWPEREVVWATSHGTRPQQP